MRGRRLFMRKNTIEWIMMGIILFSTILCILLGIGLRTGEFLSNSIIHLGSAIPAIIAFAFAIILARVEKRISIYSVFAGIIGLLFLANTIIEFGYRPLTQNGLSIEEIKFYAGLRPQGISLGLWRMGIGMSYVLVGFLQMSGKYYKNRIDLDQKTLRVFGIFMAILGVIQSLTGFNMFVNGVYPL
jgi:hypothetical protein